MGKTKKLEKLNPQCCECRLEAMKIIHKMSIEYINEAAYMVPHETHRRFVKMWQDWFNEKPPKDCRCR